MFIHGGRHLLHCSVSCVAIESHSRSSTTRSSNRKSVSWNVGATVNELYHEGQLVKEEKWNSPLSPHDRRDLP